MSHESGLQMQGALARWKRTGGIVTTNDFFNETTQQSAIKANIISKYFWAWAKVIMATVKKSGGKIAYIDLFAGPGRYKDGAKSTPLLILEKAIEDTDMCQMLVTIFNDVDSNNTRSLETAINALPGIETLKYAPRVANREVGGEIVELFEQMRLVPTFFFVDPWGYKGLSLRLINSVLRNWGCDCVFFFNYNRINMGLGNDIVREHMDALFGEARANALRSRLSFLTGEERELAIVEEICQALRETGQTGSVKRYVLPFCFRNNTGSRTSHHLIFVSKDFKGYEIMKEVMAGESSTVSQGVSSFQYCPADERQPLLFEMARPLDDLADLLLTEFAGKRLTMQDVYRQHSVDKPYTARNYKAVLRQMEANGSITADPPAAKRRVVKGEVSFGDNVMVTFPRRRNR